MSVGQTPVEPGRLALTRDERQCLVLCDLAHSMWEKMKDDVDMAWPTFMAVHEQQKSESTARAINEFRSVQMCLLSTYAMKVPVLVAKSREEKTDIVFLAIACDDGRLDDRTVTGPFIRSIQRDLVRHVERDARVVVCGEHTGALFAQRLTVDLLGELKSDSARCRVSCVSVGSSCDLWFESRQQFFAVQGSFTSFSASVHLAEIDATAPPTDESESCPQAGTLYRRVGSQFTVKIREDGNTQLQHLNEVHSPSTSPTQQWQEVRRGFTTNLQFYLAASVVTADTTSAELPRSDEHVPSQVEACVLCGETCGLFHISEAGRQVDGVALDVLQRALEYVCTPISRRLQQGEDLPKPADQVEEWLREKNTFNLLECLVDFTKQKDDEKSGEAFRKLVAQCLLQDRLSGFAVAKTVTDERVNEFLARIMNNLTSALEFTSNDVIKRVLQVDPARASGSGVAGVGGLLAAAKGAAAAKAAAALAIQQGFWANALMAVGVNVAPTATVGSIVAAGAAAAAPVVLGTTVVAGGVVAGVHFYNKSVEKSMSTEERCHRYQAVLQLFLDAALEDSRWLCLSASQLESLLMEKVRDDIHIYNLSQVGVPKWFSEITEDSLAAALLRIDMAKTIQRLRRSLTQTWHIALVGAQNAGKSTMLKEVWQRGDVPDIGLRAHTTEAGIYPITPKVKVIDFPGTTAQGQSVREEFQRLSAMVGIIVFLAKYDGSLNTELIHRYKHVREFAGDAPILVCLTQISRSWEDEESLHDNGEVNSFRHEVAQSLGCAVENLLLTEVKRRTEEMAECGVAGCEEIRHWLEKQLVRMAIYNDGDEELGIAVGRVPP